MGTTARAADGSPHADDGRYRRSLDGERRRIERNGEDSSTDRVEKVAALEISGVRTALEQHVSGAIDERLRHDLRLVPPVVPHSLGQREEDRSPVRQHLGTMRDLVTIDGDDAFRSAAATRYLQNASSRTCHTHEDAFTAPADSGEVGDARERCNGRGRPTDRRYPSQGQASVGEAGERDGRVVG